MCANGGNHVGDVNLGVEPNDLREECLGCDAPTPRDMLEEGYCLGCIASDPQDEEGLDESDPLETDNGLRGSTIA